MRCSRLELLGCGQISSSSGGTAASARTSFAGLSSRRPLKAACRTMPSPVQPANSISAISFGLTQVTSFALRGAPLPVKGLLSVDSATSFLRRPPELLLVKAGSHPTRMDEVITAINPDQKRTQIARASAPTADHHFLAASAFGLKPGIGAAGLIRRGGAFRDDAFEVEPARRLQHGVAWFSQMLNVFDDLSGSAVPVQQGCCKRALRSVSGRRRRSSPSANKRSKTK